MQGPPIPPEQQQMGPAPMEQGPPGTLGQVAGMASPGPSGGDLSERYNQMLQFTQQAYAPLMRQPLPEAPLTPARILANIVTFGGVGVADSYRAAYNRRIQDRNDALTLAAHRDAMGLVEKQAEIEALGGRQNLAMMNLAARLSALDLQIKDSTRQEFHRRWSRAMDTTMPQPSLEQQEMADAMGQTYAPVPGLPGRYRPVPRNSPLGEAGLAGGEDASAGTEEEKKPKTPAEIVRERRAAAENAAKPLDAETQKAISALVLARVLVHRALTEFNPEERRKFVGLMRDPYNRFTQLFQSDPRFQAWQALVGQLQEYKFSKGGANLTKQEIATVERFLPTGTEWGGGDEFEVKANEFYRNSLAHIRERLQASQGRGVLEKQYSPTTTTTTTTQPGQRTIRLRDGTEVIEEP